MAFSKSKKYFQQTSELLAGRSDCGLIPCADHSMQALIFKSGKGSALYDVDGKQYADYFLGGGVHLLGHANHNVVLAAKKYAERGINLGSTLSEIDMARFIVRCVPSIEKICFVNSGTEATLSAIRLARHVTGRRHVVSFEGAYHGFHGLVPGGPKQDSSANLSESSIVLPYNDLDAFEKMITSRPDQIACVIIEPVAVHMGIIAGDIDFLKGIRELTQKFGIILIFDEIMTAFRGFVGGYQSIVNITPDLTCLGGVIGGGFPVGAYGGRAELMHCLYPEGTLHQSGTLAGGQVVLRAGLMAMRLMNQPFYLALNKKANYFVSSLNDFFTSNNISCRIKNYYSTMQLVFSSESPSNYSEVQAFNNPTCYRKLTQHLLSRGILFPVIGTEPFHISGKHSKKEIDVLITEIKNFFMDENN